MFVDFDFNIVLFFDVFDKNRNTVISFWKNILNMCEYLRLI
jgi:hypothetical protein